MTLLILTTRQNALCVWVCVRERERERFQEDVQGICYVHFCCQLAPQLQNYSSLRVTTYQESWTGRFVSVYAWMEQLPLLDSFLVSLLSSKRSLLNVSLYIVIHREMLASQKCHAFCRIWLKLVTTSKHMPLTHICSHSSVRRWTQSTHIFSYKQKWDGFLKVDHQPEFLSYKNHARFFFLEKQSLLEAHFSGTE